MGKLIIQNVLNLLSSFLLQIHFRPGKRLKKLVKNLNYDKVSNGVSNQEPENEIAA